MRVIDPSMDQDKVKTENSHASPLWRHSMKRFCFTFSRVELYTCIDISHWSQLYHLQARNNVFEVRNLDLAKSNPALYTSLKTLLFFFSKKNYWVHNRRIHRFINIIFYLKFCLKICLFSQISFCMLIRSFCFLNCAACRINYLVFFKF